MKRMTPALCGQKRTEAASIAEGTGNYGLTRLMPMLVQKRNLWMGCATQQLVAKGWSKRWGETAQVAIPTHAIILALVRAACLCSAPIWPTSNALLMVCR